MTVNDIQIIPKTKDKYLMPVRKRVGVVFQFPESQLFEDTVERKYYLALIILICHCQKLKKEPFVYC